MSEGQKKTRIRKSTVDKINNLQEELIKQKHKIEELEIKRKTEIIDIFSKNIPDFLLLDDEAIIKVSEIINKEIKK